MTGMQEQKPTPGGDAQASINDQAPANGILPPQEADLVGQLRQALEEANTKIEELRNANEVLTYENANLTTKLESWQGMDAQAALDEQQEQNRLKIAECEELKTAVENLKREIFEGKDSYKGVLRFLHDPTNSPGEKQRMIQRELAKP